MANDPNSGLRDELKAALAVIVPQINGLTLLNSLPIPAEAKAEIEIHINNRTHRRDLIEHVLDALDNVFVTIKALDADGYPSLPKAILPPQIFEELQEALGFLGAALDLLKPPNDVATTVSVNMGEPTDKQP